MKGSFILASSSSGSKNKVTTHSERKEMQKADVGWNRGRKRERETKLERDERVWLQIQLPCFHLSLSLSGNTNVSILSVVEKVVVVVAVTVVMRKLISPLDAVWARGSCVRARCANFSPFLFCSPASLPFHFYPPLSSLLSSSLSLSLSFFRSSQTEPKQSAKLVITATELFYQ